MSNVLKYIKLASKVAGMKETLAESKETFVEVLEEVKELDGYQEKIVAIFEALDESNDDILALVYSALELVEIATGDDIDEDVVTAAIEKLFTYGTYVYKVLTGEIDAVVALAEVAELLEDLEA
jgi:hypothetical protein